MTLQKWAAANIVFSPGVGNLFFESVVLYWLFTFLPQTGRNILLSPAAQFTISSCLLLYVLEPHKGREHIFLPCGVIHFLCFVKMNNVSDQDEDQEDQDTEQVEEEPEGSKTETATITYDDETQKLIEQANHARTEYQDADQQVRDIENEAKSIEEYLEKDYGPEEEYAVLQVKFQQYLLK